MTKKRYIVYLLGWFLAGLISWQLSVLMSSHGLSSYCTPVLIYMKGNIPILVQPALFFMYHISDYLFGAIIAGIICYYSVSRFAYILTFIVGASWYSFIITITTFIYFSKEYPKVPSWGMTTVILNLISILIVFPIVVFVTCRFVSKRKRTLPNMEDAPDQKPVR